MLRHVHEQNRAHPVIGEPLPHLGEEDDVQAFGLLAQLQEDREPRDQGDHDSDRNNDIHLVLAQMPLQGLSDVHHAAAIGSSPVINR